MSEVFLALNLQNSQKVVVKKILYTADQNIPILRFKREVEALSNITHPHIVKIEEFFQDSNAYYIIMEYYEGDVLRKIIPKLSIMEKIKVIIKITDALCYIHSRNIIHRDLKPENILVKRGEDIDVRLVDFGMAYFLDYRDIFKKGSIVGTLAYLSPEQTGLLNREIDSRSDLYSLGIILYELLTGTQPFVDREAARLIHKHLARTPAEPINVVSGISPFLNGITMKLLCKEPGDRYQSAEGLKNDLEEYLKNPKNNHYQIASQDKPIGLNYYIKLVNKNNELTQLLQAFKSAEEGKSPTVFISGEKGTGKTRMVEALRETIISPENIFLQYRCNQKDKNTPFSAIKGVLEKYLDSIPEKEKQHIIHELKNEEYVLLSAMLKASLDSHKYQQETKKKKNTEIQDIAFFTALMNLFILISKSKNTLSVFFDDAEFMDSSSRNCILYFSQNLANSKILLILASAQNEEMNHFAKTLGQKTVNTLYIHSKNLEKQYLPEFVSGVLGNAPKADSKFYDEIYNISLGNPLLVFEILKFYNEKGVIRKTQDNWTINTEIIQSLQLKNSILETLLDRLEKFSIDEIRILSYAAVIGHDFHFEFLIKLSCMDEFDFLMDDMLTVVDKALFERIIERNQTSARRSYRFVHNGIMEALINKFDKTKMNRLNVYCAEILENDNHYNPDEVLFAIAHYYNRTDREDKKYHYNELAYQKSFSTYAIKETVYYLKKVVDYLIDNRQFNNATLEKALTLASYMQLTGDISGSFHYIDFALLVANDMGDVIKQVQAKLTSGIGYLYLSDTEKAGDKFLEAISLAEENKIELKQGVPYRLAGSACWFSSKFEKAKYYYTKAISYLAPEDYENLAPAYGLRAWCHIMTGNIKSALEDVNKLELFINFLHDSLLLPYSFHHAAIVYAFLNQEEKALKYSQKTYEYGEKMNNIIAVFSSYLSQSFYYLFKGDFDNTISTVNTALDFSGKNKTYLGIDYFYGNLAEAYLWKKEYEKAYSVTQKNFHSPGLNIYPLCQMIAVQSVYLYLKGNIEGTLNRLDEARDIYEKHNAVPANAFNLFFRWKLLELTGNQKESKKAEKLFKRLFIKNSDLKFLAARAEALYKSFKDESYHFSSIGSSSVKEALQLENIIQTSQALLTIRESDELLKSIVSKTLEVTGASRGALLLYNDNHELTPAAELNFQNSQEPFGIPETVIQEAISTKKAVVITDFQGNLYQNLNIQDTEIKSILALPIILKDEMMGLLYLDSVFIHGLFSEEHIRLLNVFTAQAAISIDNARAYKALKKEKDMLDERIQTRTREVYDAKAELEKLNDITVHLSKSLDIETIFDKIVNYLQSAYDFEGYVLYLIDKQAAKYRVETFRLPDLLKKQMKKMKGMEFPLDYNNGLVAQCLLNDEIFYRSEITPEEFQEPVNSRVVSQLQIQSILNIPVHLEDEIIGLFSLTGHLKHVYLKQEDIDAICRFVNQISVIVRNSKLWEEIKKTKDMLELKDKILSLDLSMAKKIQTGYIQCDLEKIPEIDIALHFQPMIEVGGDIFDIFKFKENYYRILIADATGHGIQAALITMLIKSEYDKIKIFDLSAETVIQVFNQAFMDYYSQLNMYFSCALVDIDLENNVLYYSSAGHPDQFLVTPEQLITLQSGGTILGISEKSHYELMQINLPDEWKIVLFTDGLFEEFDEPDKDKGELYLKTIIEEHSQMDVHNLAESIISKVNDWRQNHLPQDDITLLVISKKNLIQPVQVD